MRARQVKSEAGEGDEQPLLRAHFTLDADCSGTVGARSSACPVEECEAVRMNVASHLCIPLLERPRDKVPGKRRGRACCLSKSGHQSLTTADYVEASFLGCRDEGAS